MPLTSFIAAVPVAGPSLELHRLVVERFTEFGDSGGLAVWWRPMSSPTLADPIYKQLRSPAMARRDHNDARKYLRLCSQAGGEDNYVRGEYFKLAARFGIREESRPTLVLAPIPDCGAAAWLPIVPAAFEGPERQRAVACFLQQELSESRLKQFAFDGEFDGESVSGLQRHADAIAKMIAETIAKDRPVGERTWRTHLVQNGLDDIPEPEVHTTAVAWRRNGSAFLRTETNGAVDGELAFITPESGDSKQGRLLWWLLLKWPHGLSFREIALEFYGVDYRAALKADDRQAMAVVAKRVRALIHDIRFKRLAPSGINVEILPSIMKTRSGRSEVRLRLADLDRSRLGQLARRSIR